MEKEFVTLEQFRELFELGYDIHDMSIVSTYTQKPLKQQVFRWFREKYDFLVIIRDIEIIASDKSGYRWKWIIFRLTEDIYIAEDKSLLGSLTYEEAENACIDKLIELAKQQDGRE